MSLLLSAPYFDLAHSQYLWPSPAVELRALAADATDATAAARAEHKALLQRQFDSSRAFQRQFVLFVAQLVHQQQRAADLLATAAEAAAAATAAPDLSPSSATAAALLFPPAPDLAPAGRKTGTPAAAAAETRAVLPRWQHTLLVPPRPRVCSALSPAPRDTPLPGPLRRPMPPPRARAAPEALLRHALRNATHAGRSTKPAADVRDGRDDDDPLGQSWVDVRAEDWELVDTST